MLLPFQWGKSGRPDYKHYDLQISYSVPTTSASDSLTGPIASGATETTLIGNTIFIKQVDLELFVSNADSNNFVKIFLCACPNGQNGAPAYSAWYLPPDNDQYIILKEAMIATSTNMNTGSCVKFKHTFPGKGLLVRYDTAATQTELINRLWLSYVSDSSVAPHPSIQGYCRVYFTDV